MSYIRDHPTQFNFTRPTRRRINTLQRHFPKQTYANTYWKHPPDFGNTYTSRSVDFWGGGVVNGRYVGYRGKHLPERIGIPLFRKIIRDSQSGRGPRVLWAIYRGRMFANGRWGPSPPGPSDSDPAHYSHIHVTYAA